MADNTPNDEGTDTVSREAFERVQGENQTLQAKVNELDNVVREVAVKDKARVHFADKGVTDPEWAAEVALPHLKGVGNDDIEATLDGRFSNLYPSETPDDPIDDGVATPDRGTTPFAGPSPGAEGGKVESEKFQAMSKEMKQLRRDDEDAFKRLDKEGRIIWRTAEASFPG